MASQLNSYLLDLSMEQTIYPYIGKTHDVHHAREHCQEHQEAAVNSGYGGLCGAGIV
jgi:hypothetical protein